MLDLTYFEHLCLEPGLEQVCDSKVRKQAQSWCEASYVKPVVRFTPARNAAMSIASIPR